MRLRFASLLAIVLSGCSSAPPAPTHLAKPEPPVTSASAEVPPAPPPAAKSAPATRIALDEDGGCAVMKDGGLSCWGGAHASPRRLVGATGVVDVSLGFEIAALREGGSVITYPRGATTEPPQSLHVTGIRSLSQGAGSACALRDDGKVICWPHGFHDASGGEIAPLEVKGLARVKAVSASGGHACAIEEDERLTCWPIVDKGVSRFERIAGLAKVVEVQLGPSVVCAKDESRAVSCFYYEVVPRKISRVGETDLFSFSGGVGDAPAFCVPHGEGVECTRPEPLSGSYSLPALEAAYVASREGGAAKQIAAAKWAACFLDVNGAVHCWGLNIRGLLGQPDSRFVEAPTVVPDLPKMKSIAVGDRFSCALSVEGKVYCWGQRGGFDVENKAPIQGHAAEVPNLGHTTRIVANAEYACAYDDGDQATCFYGPVDERGVFHPVRVPTFDGARGVRLPDLGFANIVAAISSKGALLVGPTPGFDTLEGLALHEVKGVGKVHALTTVSMGLFGAPRSYGFAIALADDGHAYSVEETDGGTGKPVRLRGLDGALAIQSGGLALLPGGKIVSARLGGEAHVEVEKSPLVSLVDGGMCGFTADHRFGCVDASGKLTESFDHPVDAAMGARGHQCALDEAGVVRCEGANDWGQCGVTVGLARAEVPVDLHFD